MLKNTWSVKLGKKNHKEGMRSKGKIKQSHGGGVFMVKPTRRVEVIKKNKVIGSEWKVRVKKNNLSKGGWQKWRKKITWREWEVRKRTMSQGTSTK
jgi:hypothetical protein